MIPTACPYRGAARIAGVTSFGSFVQSVDAKPGEHYVVQVWNRQQGHGAVWVTVCWQTADGKWINQSSNVSMHNQQNTSDKDGWRKIQGDVTVPEGSGKIVITLSATSQASPQDVVWYDDVQLYKID
jgi:hypothetical protein